MPAMAGLVVSVTIRSLSALSGVTHSKWKGAKYKTFRAITFRFLNRIGEHKKELSTLMVEKFEIVRHKA